MTNESQEHKDEPAGTHTLSFLSGATIGALAGAGWGLVLTIPLILLMHMTIPIFLAIEAVSIIFMSIKEGNKAVERHKTRHHQPMPSESELASSRERDRGPIPGNYQQPSFIQRLDRQERRHDRAEFRAERREDRRPHVERLREERSGEHHHHR